MYSNVSHLLAGVDLAIELVLILHELEDDLVPLVVIQLLLTELDVLVLGDGIGVISIPIFELR
jgi:hypothetical protein